MENNSINGNLETATLGGGCFWCIETLFQDLKGVTLVESGYAGGKNPNPTYQEICTGMTGHAEVIQVHFNPEIITFSEILEVFFTMHDPTTLNRQGADVGTQYRSVIFYNSEQQLAESQLAIEAAEKVWDKKIVTELSPLPTFYKAEAYHQNYYKNNPYQGYCSVVISPKVRKLREKYADKLK